MPVPEAVDRSTMRVPKSRFRTYSFMDINNRAFLYMSGRFSLYQSSLGRK